jgi:hypothetical protein
MSGLRAIMVVAVTLGLSGCNREPICDTAPGEKSPSTLPELLKAHDAEVRKHGKDICYIKAIGAFGRQGVLASLQHITEAGEPVSSYNNTELVIGVAEEARTKTGYDICKDAPTLNRMSAMAKASDAPAYPRTRHADLVSGLCKTVREPDEAGNASQGTKGIAR